MTTLLKSLPTDRDQFITQSPLHYESPQDKKQYLIIPLTRSVLIYDIKLNEYITFMNYTSNDWKQISVDRYNHRLCILYCAEHSIDKLEYFDLQTLELTETIKFIHHCPLFSWEKLWFLHKKYCYSNWWAPIGVILGGFISFQVAMGFLILFLIGTFAYCIGNNFTFNPMVFYRYNIEQFYMYNVENDIHLVGYVENTLIHLLLNCVNNKIIELPGIYQLPRNRNLIYNTTKKQLIHCSDSMYFCNLNGNNGYLWRPFHDSIYMKLYFGKQRTRIVYNDNIVFIVSDNGNGNVTCFDMLCTNSFFECKRKSLINIPYNKMVDIEAICIATGYIHVFFKQYPYDPHTNTISCSIFSNEEILHIQISIESLIPTKLKQLYTNYYNKLVFGCYHEWYQNFKDYSILLFWVLKTGCTVSFFFRFN